MTKEELAIKYATKHWNSYEAFDPSHDSFIAGYIAAEEQLKAEVERLREYIKEVEWQRNEWQRNAKMLRGLLSEVNECPFTVDSATVPKIGITEAPPYQVVVVLSMAWTKLQEIRKALEEKTK